MEKINNYGHHSIAYPSQIHYNRKINKKRFKFNSISKPLFKLFSSPNFIVNYKQYFYPIKTFKNIKIVEK